MDEVSGPVIGIALILSSVFVPMAFMGGIKGLLNQQFAITIAISVLISAFNALTLSPALVSPVASTAKAIKGPFGRFFGWFNRTFGKITGGYVSWSHVLIRRSVIALLLLVGFRWWPETWAKSLPTSFIPEEDQGYAFIQLQLPDAASLQRTDAVMRKMDDILAHTHGVQGYDAIAGFSLLSNTSSTYSGFYFLQFDPWEERRLQELSAKGLMRTSQPENRARKFRRQSDLPSVRPPFRALARPAASPSCCRIAVAGQSNNFTDNSGEAHSQAARKRPELPRLSPPSALRCRNFTWT